MFQYQIINNSFEEVSIIKLIYKIYYYLLNIIIIISVTLPVVFTQSYNMSTNIIIIYYIIYIILSINNEIETIITKITRDIVHFYFSINLKLCYQIYGYTLYYFYVRRYNVRHGFTD